MYKNGSYDMKRKIICIALVIMMIATIIQTFTYVEAADDGGMLDKINTIAGGDRKWRCR